MSPNVLPFCGCTAAVAHKMMQLGLVTSVFVEYEHTLNKWRLAPPKIHNYLCDLILNQMANSVT